jgi:DNA-binding MarR family transcriptional regulator
VPRTSDDEALLAVLRLTMDVSVRAAGELGNLSPVQLRALTALQMQPGMNLAQLADRLGVTVSTASRLVDRLIAADWVHRRPASHTRREISLTLTDAGRAALRQYDDRRVGYLRDCLDTLAPDRRAAVVASLTELSSLLAP